MAKAILAKELMVDTDNKIGMLADISSLITDAGVNITAICAYAVADKAIFRIITSDNNKAKSALAQKGFKVRENDVVTVMLADKAGQAKMVADKIKKAGINLDSLYGTTCGCKDMEALLVIGSKESAKVISAINS
ncbi:MAG: hypothetical protein PHS93_02200 [Candidatus Omnitrophica bacterium]|nr:hypothetical protein [Candidatus Omnitrophota bacterium]MDD5351964.1 hypothetical protein [Candidatus Omnitrophota bacterium]MDD5550790.1 hypothetical protein [Candidatus Omnitrophota bacterium]